MPTNRPQSKAAGTLDLAGFLSTAGEIRLAGLYGCVHDSAERAWEISMKNAVLPLALILALAAPADAQKNKDKGAPASQKSTEAVGVTFGATAEHEIRSYFQANQLAPQGLPPGIAKNLARGKPLPKGIAKRTLPAGLQTRLPAYPGHEVIIVDRDVFLVNVATQVIVDILTRVL
jgi:hypothetical protein